jgi:hypothetical protein
MDSQARKVIDEFARQILKTTNSQDIKRLIQQIEEFAGAKMVAWLRTCLESPKERRPDGRSRFLWDASAPKNEPLTQFGHGYLGGSEQTIELVFAKFCAEMEIDAGDPSQWKISFRHLDPDGLNHTFLTFGNREVEVRWANDRWLFGLPKKRDA